MGLVLTHLLFFLSLPQVDFFSPLPLLPSRQQGRVKHEEDLGGFFFTTTPVLRRFLFPPLSMHDLRREAAAEA